MTQSRQTALFGVTLLAALGVGVLIGRSGCAPKPEVVVKERVVEKTQDCPPCRPDTGDVAEPDAAPPPSDPEPPPDKRHRAMPEAPEPPDPEQRRKLLTWVRDRAPNLRGCRPSGGSGVQLAVTLVIGEDGKVEQADINAPKDDLSVQELQCLRDEMVQWAPPTKLVEGRREIVFGLEL